MLGHRRCLVRARARRARRTLPADLRALRAARGGAPGLPADVERRRRPLRGHSTTSWPRPSSVPQPLQPGRPADPDRRQRRAQDAAAGGEVRRRVQPVRRRARRRCGTRSRCSTGTAPTEGRDPSRDPAHGVIAGADPLADPDAFLRRMEELAALGIDQVWVGPQAEDPVGSVARMCEEVLPRLAGDRLSRSSLRGMTDSTDLLDARPGVGRGGPRPRDAGRARGPDRGRGPPRSWPTGSTARSSSAPPACAARSAPVPTG